MAIALSPDKTRVRHRSAGRTVGAADRRRHGDAHHRRIRRRAPAGVVAGREDDRVPELSRRHVAHLDGGRRRLGSEGGDQRPVRRSRAALVARRIADRVLVGSQRQLRRLGARTSRRGAVRQITTRCGQRLLSGVVARRPRDRVRVDAEPRAGRVCHRALDGRGAPGRGVGRQPSARRRGAPTARCCSASARRPAAAAGADRRTTAQLVLDGRTIASGEDYFPFRAQWLSADEFLYPADGRIKRVRCSSGEQRRSRSAATLTLAPPAYTRKRRDFDSTTAQRVLGIMRPVVSPDGTHAGVRRAGRSVDVRRSAARRDRHGSTDDAVRRHRCRRGRPTARGSPSRPIAPGAWTSGSAICARAPTAG